MDFCYGPPTTTSLINDGERGNVDIFDMNYTSSLYKDANDYDIPFAHFVPLISPQLQQQIIEKEQGLKPLSGPSPFSQIPDPLHHPFNDSNQFNYPNETTQSFLSQSQNGNYDPNKISSVLSDNGNNNNNNNNNTKPLSQSLPTELDCNNHCPSVNYHQLHPSSLAIPTTPNHPPFTTNTHYHHGNNSYKGVPPPVNKSFNNHCNDRSYQQVPEECFKPIIKTKEDITNHLTSVHASLISTMSKASHGGPPIFLPQYQKDKWMSFLQEYGFAIFYLDDDEEEEDDDNDDNNNDNNNCDNYSDVNMYHTTQNNAVVNADGKPPHNCKITNQLLNSLSEYIVNELNMYSSLNNNNNKVNSSPSSFKDDQFILEKRGGILQGFKCPVSLLSSSRSPSLSDNNRVVKQSNFPQLTMVSPLCQSFSAWKIRGRLYDFWETLVKTSSSSSSPLPAATTIPLSNQSYSPFQQQQQQQLPTVLSSIEGFVIVDNLPLEVQPAQPLSWSPSALKSSSSSSRSQKRSGKILPSSGNYDINLFNMDDIRMFVSLTDENASFGLIPGASEVFQAIRNLDTRKSRRIQARPYAVKLTDNNLNFLFDYVLQLKLPAKTVCVWKNTVPFTVFQHKTNVNPTTKRKTPLKCKIYHSIYQQSVIYPNKTGRQTNGSKRRRRRCYNTGGSGNTLRNGLTPNSSNRRVNRSIGQLVAFFPRNELTNSDCNDRIRAFNTCEMLNDHHTVRHSWSNQGKRPEHNWNNIKVPYHNLDNLLLSDKIKSLIGCNNINYSCNANLIPPLPPTQPFSSTPPPLSLLPSPWCYGCHKSQCYIQNCDRCIRGDSRLCESCYSSAFSSLPRTMVNTNTAAQQPQLQQYGFPFTFNLLPPPLPLSLSPSMNKWHNSLENNEYFKSINNNFRHSPPPPSNESFSANIIDNTALLNLSGNVNQKMYPLVVNNGNFATATTITQQQKSSISPLSESLNPLSYQQQQQQQQQHKMDEIINLLKNQNLKWEEQTKNHKTQLDKHQKQVNEMKKEIKSLKEQRHPLSFALPSQQPFNIEYIKAKSDVFGVNKESNPDKSVSIDSDEEEKKNGGNDDSNHQKKRLKLNDGKYCRSDADTAVIDNNSQKKIEIDDGITNELKENNGDESSILTAMEEEITKTITRVCFICETDIPLQYSLPSSSNNDEEEKLIEQIEINHIIPLFRNVCYHCVGCRDQNGNYQFCKECNHCSGEDNDDGDKEVIINGHYIFSKENMPIKNIKLISFKEYNNPSFKHFVCKKCNELHQII